MAIYKARAILPDDQPGPWGDPVSIRYDQRDVLLYAVGIGIEHLGFVFEGHREFAVFPTFPIRWGGAGVAVDPDLLPPSAGPLNIDAERYLEMLAPLPIEGEVTVQSRIIGIHPRGKGAGFVEYESIVSDADGRVCAKMVNGSFRRGVKELGDIEPFDDVGQTYSARITSPNSEPHLTIEASIASNQGNIYRLSGDYNPLHIDPEAARFGGFDQPILHGLCTFGHCGQLLLGALCDNDASRFRKIKLRFSFPVTMGDLLTIRAWKEGPGRVIFEAVVKDKVVISNAYFEYDQG